MDPFVAEIRIFGCNFAPVGWAFCNGQLLSIASNTALFSLVGTYYGGNGTTTFGLPNLQGKAAISQGQGPGLSNYVLGEQTGSENVSLNSNQNGVHNHNVNCYNDAGDSPGPAANVLGAAGADRGLVMYSTAATGATVGMNPAQLAVSGSGSPHNNMSPYFVLNYCIALQGVYPSRN
jgi:microcystin-dependent protein